MTLVLGSTIHPPIQSQIPSSNPPIPSNPTLPPPFPSPTHLPSTIPSPTIPSHPPPTLPPQPIHISKPLPSTTIPFPHTNSPSHIPILFPTYPIPHRPPLSFSLLSSPLLFSPSISSHILSYHAISVPSRTSHVHVNFVIYLYIYVRFGKRDGDGGFEYQVSQFVSVLPYSTLLRLLHLFPLSFSLSLLIFSNPPSLPFPSHLPALPQPHPPHNHSPASPTRISHREKRKRERAPPTHPPTAQQTP